MPTGFDRFMVHVAIGPNRKMRRLTPEERWAFVAGILALAAEAPTRGHLVLSEGVPLTAADVADQAGVSEAAAASALEKLRKLGTIAKRDDGVEYLASWERMNPKPRPSDTREAWAARKRLERGRKKAADTLEHDAKQPQLGRKGTGMRGIQRSGNAVSGLASDGRRTPPAPCPGTINDPRWDVACAALMAGGDSERVAVWMDGVHVHAVTEGSLLIGSREGTASWNNDRLAPRLQQMIGSPVRFEDCACAAAAEDRKRGAA